MNGLYKLLEELAKSDDSKILYILSLIVIAMIVDFAVGVLAAWINKEVVSQKGINGILRKLMSIIVLFFAIPIAPLIPGGIGSSALYVLYFGYLWLEVASIIENYRKLGVNREATLFVKFFGMLNTKNDETDQEQ